MIKSGTKFNYWTVLGFRTLNCRWATKKEQAANRRKRRRKMHELPSTWYGYWLETNPGHPEDDRTIKRSVLNQFKKFVHSYHMKGQTPKITNFRWYVKHGSGTGFVEDMTGSFGWKCQVPYYIEEKKP